MKTLLALLLLCSSALGAESFHLEWTAYPEAVAGYKLYYTDGVTVSCIDTGNVTTIWTPLLPGGVTYTMWLTAYSVEPSESEPSNKLLLKPRLSPPGNLKVVTVEAAASLNGPWEPLVITRVESNSAQQFFRARIEQP